MQTACGEERTLDILVKMTGLPIARKEKILDSGKPAAHYRALLQDEVEQYEIGISTGFLAEGFFVQPVSQWFVEYNGVKLCRLAHKGSTYSRLAMKRAWEEEITACIGGPRLITGFFDYGHCSVDEIAAGSTISANAYLVVMAHLKERGFVMPPILGNEPEFINAALGGKSRILAELFDEKMKAMDGLAAGIEAHMQAEYQLLAGKAERVQMLLDPEIPLHRKASTPYFIVDKGRGEVHHVLALASEGDAGFAERVYDELAKSGEYRLNTVVYAVDSMAGVKELCSAGQVDLVIADQRAAGKYEYWLRVLQNRLKSESIRPPEYIIVRSAAQLPLMADSVKKILG